MSEVPVRTLLERREAAVERLRTTTNLWLATASDGRGPHLIPVSYWWDGARLTTATSERSRTARNVRAQPRVRAALGSTGDVLMIDAMAAIVSWDEIDEPAAEGYAQASGVPRSMPRWVYIRLIPQRMQLWQSPAEFAGRTVMRHGAWLDTPID